MERSSSSSQAHRNRTGSTSLVSTKISRSFLSREGVFTEINNSYAHTEKGWLPEGFLPEFLDMVIWGHEHECLIDPRYNPEMNFHVMQPGSSVATSLMPGEAVPKHVAVLSITGRDFAVEKIRLKTVRPFVMREIVLSEEKQAMKLAKKANNRTALTEFLTGIVDDMIAQANEEWKTSQGDEEQEEDEHPPLPLIRLRVEYTAPEGGHFDCENPQRFSNRFDKKVANVQDVVQFYRKKKGGTKRAQNGAEVPEESTLASLGIDSVKVGQLVREFLDAQSLTILPQNSFVDAVSQFIDKDDKFAMKDFVTENLEKQVEQLMKMDNVDENNIQDAMEQGKSHLEELFAAGHRSARKKTERKPRPDGWDSDLNGAWDDQPAAIHRSELEDEDEDESDEPAAKPTAKGRGKAAPKKAAAPAKRPAPAKASRGRKKVVESEEEEEEDVVMLDSDDDESQLFVKQEPPTRVGTKAAPAKTPAAKRAPPRAAASGKQTQLNFSQSTTQPRPGAQKVQEVSDDDISDDDDAFEPAPSARGSRSRR